MNESAHRGVRHNPCSSSFCRVSGQRPSSGQKKGWQKFLSVSSVTSLKTVESIPFSWAEEADLGTPSSGSSRHDYSYLGGRVLVTFSLPPTLEWGKSQDHLPTSTPE